MLIEGSLVPAVTATGQIKLTMPKELIGNEHLLLEGLSKVIMGKCDNDLAYADEFRRDIAVLRFTKYNRRMDDELIGKIDTSYRDTEIQRCRDTDIPHTEIQRYRDTEKHTCLDVLSFYCTYVAVLFVSIPYILYIP